MNESNGTDLYSAQYPYNFTENTATNLTSNLCDFPPSAKNLAISLLLTGICIVTFFGNLAVCVTVYANSALHSTTNFLIVSLASADLLVSLLSMPFRIYYMLHNEVWCLNFNVCALWIWVDLAVCSASIGSLAAVSIERFIAVKHPLRYTAILTRRTGLTMILIVWSYSALWASLGHYNWTSNRWETFRTHMGCGKNDRLYYTIVSSAAFFLPLAIVIGAYSYLTKVAFQQRQRVLANMVGPTDEAEKHRKSLRRSRILHELKAAKMMACVVGAFCISWLPFFILLHLSLWHSLQRIPAVGTIFVTILPNLNSSLNPFLYIMFTRELREYVWKMIKALPGIAHYRANSRNSVEGSFQTLRMTIANTDLQQSLDLSTQFIKWKSLWP